MLTLLTILNVLIAGLSTVFIVKNYLINYCKSTKAIKNVVVAICIFIPLLFSFVNIFSGLTISQSKAQLKYELSISKDNIIGQNGETEKERLQADIDELDDRIPGLEIYTIIGIVSYTISFVLYKNILKEVKEIKLTGTWNLNKIK